MAVAATPRWTRSAMVSLMSTAVDAKHRPEAVPSSAARTAGTRAASQPEAADMSRNTTAVAARKARMIRSRFGAPMPGAAPRTDSKIARPPDTLTAPTTSRTLMDRSVPIVPSRMANTNWVTSSAWTTAMEPTCSAIACAPNASRFTVQPVSHSRSRTSRRSRPTADSRTGLSRSRRLAARCWQAAAIANSSAAMTLSAMAADIGLQSFEGLPQPDVEVARLRHQVRLGGDGQVEPAGPAQRADPQRHPVGERQQWIHLAQRHAGERHLHRRARHVRHDRAEEPGAVGAAGGPRLHRHREQAHAAQYGRAGETAAGSPAMLGRAVHSQEPVARRQRSDRHVETQRGGTVAGDRRPAVAGWRGWTQGQRDGRSQCLARGLLAAEHQHLADHLADQREHHVGDPYPGSLGQRPYPVERQRDRTEGAVGRHPPGDRGGRGRTVKGELDETNGAEDGTGERARPLGQVAGGERQLGLQDVAQDVDDPKAVGDHVMQQHDDGALTGSDPVYKPQLPKRPVLVEAAAGQPRHELLKGAAAPRGGQRGRPP